MSRYGRLDRGPDGRVTEHDKLCWRDLIAAAAAAGATDAPLGELEAVARAARHACAPGVATRDNACVRLVRISERYLGETARGRRAMGAELTEASQKAAALLAAFEAGAGRDGGAGRERKDIEG